MRSACGPGGAVGGPLDLGAGRCRVRV